MENSILSILHSNKNKPTKTPPQSQSLYSITLAIRFVSNEWHTANLNNIDYYRAHYLLP